MPGLRYSAGLVRRVAGVNPTSTTNSRSHQPCYNINMYSQPNCLKSALHLFLPSSIPRRIFEAAATVPLLLAQTSITYATPANIAGEKRDPTYGFPYGSTTIRGVNLGSVSSSCFGVECSTICRGWLVLEICRSASCVECLLWGYTHVNPSR